MKIGLKRKFNHPQAGMWELKEIVNKPNMKLEWTWQKLVCPHCEKPIVITKTYKLEKLFIWENSKGETFTTSETEPVTRDGKPLHMRLPDKNFCADKDMSDKVKKKSKYLKEKSNGN